MPFKLIVPAFASSGKPGKPALTGANDFDRRGQIDRALRGHILDEVDYIGRYERR